MPRNFIDPEKRLLSQRIISKKGCWEFKGAKDNEGYGVMSFLGKRRKSHRISAFLYMKFDIESSLKTLHKCDNRACFNPKHLFFGTQADNVRDMDKKGRRRNDYKIGEKNSQAKLTEKQVKKILKLRNQGVQQKILWKQFNISRSQLQRILYGNSWKHIV